MGAVLLSIICLCLYLWLCFFLADQFYEVAKAKGFDDRKYYWITFWLGFIGYMLVIALPDRGSHAAAPAADTAALNAIAEIPNVPLYDELPEL